MRRALWVEFRICAAGTRIAEQLPLMISILTSAPWLHAKQLVSVTFNIQMNRPMHHAASTNSFIWYMCQSVSIPRFAASQMADSQWGTATTTNKYEIGDYCGRNATYNIVVSTIMCARVHRHVRTPGLWLHNCSHQNDMNHSMHCAMFDFELNIIVAAITFTYCVVWSDCPSNMWSPLNDIRGCVCLLLRIASIAYIHGKNKYSQRCASRHTGHMRLDT